VNTLPISRIYQPDKERQLKAILILISSAEERALVPCRPQSEAQQGNQTTK
jgi:hypothetical protein